MGRNFRSFTILRDFTQYYQDKNFSNLEPVVFGNGLGAGGLDAVFFAHLAKNWRYGKQRVKKTEIHKVKNEGWSLVNLTVTENLILTTPKSLPPHYFISEIRIRMRTAKFNGNVPKTYFVSFIVLSVKGLDHLLYH